MYSASSSNELPNRVLVSRNSEDVYRSRKGQRANALNGIPPELLDEISYHVVTHTPLGPPSGLLPLLLTCKNIQNSLSGSLSLYSRIFRSQFDIKALERRFPRDWLTSQVLVHELRRRWVVLKRIRHTARLWRNRHKYDGPAPLWARDEVGNMTDELWTAFLMLLESDGRNREQLVEWANVDSYLEAYVCGMLIPRRKAIGFYPESLESSLVIWLAWLVMDEDALHHEHTSKLADYMGLLRSVVFGVHKYDMYFAPWFYHDLPLQTDPDAQPPSRFHEFRRRAYEADLVPRNNAQRVPYLGRQLVISSPIMAQAAILCFFLRLRRAEAAGLGQTGDTARHPGNLNLSAQPTPSTSSNQATGSADVDYQLDLTQGLCLFAPAHDSSMHDNDWDRLIACLDPYVDSYPVERPFCRPGILDGTWEGVFSFFDFDAFQDMLVGTASAGMDQNPNVLGQQPQVWRIQEYHWVPSLSSYNTRNTESQRSPISPMHRSNAPIPSSPETGKSVLDDVEVGPLPSGPPLNAHMPVGTRMEEVPGGIEVYQPTKRGCLFYRRASRVGSELGVAPVSADSSGENENNPSTDSATASVESNEQVLDILLTGTGHSAWGSFTLRGRVRPWDGLVTLLKEYSGPQSRGQWLYRGYIHAGGNWVGRWRDTVTQLEYCGYEGVYAMRARH
ncbi:hypothetical protein FRC02_011457 [Tulasnella sp. 418]|nr:hypothetical protein FRC02_011457 [Tulasnella sp. 418]